jgi:hypothetical protein
VVLYVDVGIYPSASLYLSICRYPHRFMYTWGIPDHDARRVMHRPIYLQIGRHLYPSFRMQILLCVRARVCTYGVRQIMCHDTHAHLRIDHLFSLAQLASQRKEKRASLVSKRVRESFFLRWQSLPLSLTLRVAQIWQMCIYLSISRYSYVCVCKYGTPSDHLRIHLPSLWLSESPSLPHPHTRISSLSRVPLLSASTCRGSGGGGGGGG